MGLSAAFHWVMLRVAVGACVSSPLLPSLLPRFGHRYSTAQRYADHWMVSRVAARWRMRRRKPSTLVEAFSEHGQAQLGQVAAALSLVGGMKPTLTGLRCLDYSGSNVKYSACLDAQEGSIATHVVLEGHDPRLRADLRQIVIAAGLGPAQAVRTSGRSILALKKGIESQASWILRVHGLVTGPDGAQLLRRVKLISIWRNCFRPCEMHIA